MIYPKVYSEYETLALALGGASLARFGDGELRLAQGGQSASQCRDPKLQAELVALLEKPSRALVCIPNLMSPMTDHKKGQWLRYGMPSYARMYKNPPYGSAFITRPDSAHWINTEEYWNRVRLLWKCKDVTLVVGDERSLRQDQMTGAASVRVVMSVTRDAYRQIDLLEEEIGLPSGPVIMCLGATATVLAERLAKKGLHALDLGHIGMFMRRYEQAKQEAAA